jgi:hypothetical protein
MLLARWLSPVLWLLQQIGQARKRHLAKREVALSIGSSFKTESNAKLMPSWRRG